MAANTGGPRHAPLARGRPLDRTLDARRLRVRRGRGRFSYSWEVPSSAKGLRLSKIYGCVGTITFESNGLWVLCHGTKTRFYIPRLRDLAGYRAMWTDFVRALTTGESPLMTVAQDRRDLELVEQAYASASEPPIRGASGNGNKVTLSAKLMDASTRDCLVTDYEPFNQRSYSNPSAV